jgi:hypothetical protein
MMPYFIVYAGNLCRRAGGYNNRCTGFCQGQGRCPTDSATGPRDNRNPAVE